MKHIEIDSELYQYLASQTQFIGESASSILRRLLSLPQVDEQLQNEIPKEVVSVLVQTAEDTNLSHSESPRETVFNYINKEELARQRGVIGRFFLILSALYRVHSKDFDVVVGIRGRDRLYFARSEQELAESGSSTKPRQIPDTPYWVMTNSNTTRKKMMITEAAKVLGYQNSEIEKIRDLL